MRHAWRFVGVLLGVLGQALLAQAETRSPAPAIGHGQAITGKMVGPAAAGYASLQAFPGSAIKDGKAYPFAREVLAPASYDGFEIPSPHILIEGAAFTSSLDIYTSRPVVLRGVSVRVTADSPVAVLVRPGAGPVFVLWSDIGGGRSAEVGAAIALRGARAVVARSHISDAADGLSISASDVSVTENLIESRTAAAGDHNDAIQLLGAPERITIARNKILNRNPQTSCLYLLGRGVTVRSNYLSGGGWTIYGGANNNGHGKGGASDVRVTDTIFGREYFPKSGHFGAVSYWDKSNTWHGNRFNDGASVEP